MLFFCQFGEVRSGEGRGGWSSALLRVFFGGGRDLLRLVCRGYFVDGVVEVREGGGGDVCGGCLFGREITGCGREYLDFPLGVIVMSSRRSS